jgi:hypothetical protein
LEEEKGVSFLDRFGEFPDMHFLTTPISAIIAAEKPIAPREEKYGEAQGITSRLPHYMFGSLGKRC